MQYFLHNQNQDFFKSSEALIRGFNIEFYNNLITDWINDENLIDTVRSTQSTNTQILKLKNSLEHLINNVDVELPYVVKSRNQIIEKIESN